MAAARPGSGPRWPLGPGLRRRSGWAGSPTDARGRDTPKDHSAIGVLPRPREAH